MPMNIGIEYYRNQLFDKWFINIFKTKYEEISSSINDEIFLENIYIFMQPFFIFFTESISWKAHRFYRTSKRSSTPKFIFNVKLILIPNYFYGNLKKCITHYYYYYSLLYMCFLVTFDWLDRKMSAWLPKLIRWTPDIFHMIFIGIIKHKYDRGTPC